LTDDVNDTLECFDQIIKISKKIFLSKLRDYGPSWLMLRKSSLVDQIWIKAKRIRTLEELNDDSCISEGRDVEYLGIINYSIISLMEIWYSEKMPNFYETSFDEDSLIYDENDIEKMSILYDEVVKKVRVLLIKKNHDYGEAWKQMEITSITDQILVKIFRLKSILVHQKHLKEEDGLDAQFSDIINYSIFSLIKLYSDNNSVSDAELKIRQFSFHITETVLLQ
jgi:hypothetical protein